MNAGQMGSREGPARSVSGWAPASDELDAKFELVVVRQDPISVAMFADTSKAVPLLKLPRGYYVRPGGLRHVWCRFTADRGTAGHAVKRMHIHGSSLGQISGVGLLWWPHSAQPHALPSDSTSGRR
jgi:hypothetical protein